MPVNRDIPGQLREQEMQAIEILASLVPIGGSIVEVGSLLGLSSWIWAKSAHDNVKVYCIDPWENSKASNFQDLARAEQQEFSKSQFIENTKGCNNIVALQGYSPQDFENFEGEIDLYFEDAVHTDPIFSKNIEFWSRRLKPDGILCGHDYHPKFPDVRNGAARSAAAMGRSLKVIGTLWFLLPRSMETSSDPVIRSALARLAALEKFSTKLPAPLQNEDIVAYSRRVVAGIDDFSYELDISMAPPSVKRGEPIQIKGLVRNLGNSDWPIILFGQAVLKVGAELRLANGAKLAVARAFLHLPILEAGKSVDFQLELDSSRVPVGKANAELDLVYDNVKWFRPDSKMTISVEITTLLDFPEIDPQLPVEDKRFWQQHITRYSPKTDIGITVTKEQDYIIHSDAGDIAARSMLTSYELALLFGLARHYLNGDGKIVDLGPLIGVGTNVMARGVQLNDKIKEKKRNIISYDLFLMNRMDHFLPKDCDTGTGSIFERFIEANHEYPEIICPVPGDVLKTTWTGEPIEVLLVDLAESWDLNQHVVREFFPALIPGRSILIQRNYVHIGEPWIALQMEVFRDYFEQLYFVYGASSVYRLKKSIPESLLALDIRLLSNEEIDAHFVSAGKHAPASVGEVLKCCHAAIKIERGDLDSASALLDSVNCSVVDLAEDPENFVPAIRSNLKVARRWLEQARRLAPNAPTRVAPSEPTPPAGDARFTISQFVNATYVGVLGRAADPLGLETWAQRLEAEPIHRLPNALTRSSEFLVSYLGRMVNEGASEAVATINNRLSLATLGVPLLKLRSELVASLPEAKDALDLGGASASDGGALLQMGYRKAKRIEIIDPPPGIRLKKAPEHAESRTFFGTTVHYQHHAMTDLASYADESIDLIWSGHTIGYVTLAECDVILREAKRILRKGGVFAMDAPNRTLTRLAVGDGNSFHSEDKHEYSYEDFVGRHHSTDFELVQSKGLIDMRRSLVAGYLLPDEISAGTINNAPESSFVFFAMFRKA